MVVVVVLVVVVVVVVVVEVVVVVACLGKFPGGSFPSRTAKHGKEADINPRCNQAHGLTVKEAIKNNDVYEERQGELLRHR